jgi:hypothetical protein
LYDGAYPVRFGDSSAGALDVHMRDGNSDKYSFRATANFAYAGLMAEGPLSKFDQCSWIGGFRKSYLQYLLQRTLSDPSEAFGFEDGQGRLTCKVSARNALTLGVIDGITDLDRTSVRNTLGANSLMLARQRSTVASLGWRYIPSDSFLVDSHVAWIRDSFDDLNPNRAPLGSGNYKEWVWNSNATWLWNSHTSLDAGFSVRSIRDAGYLEQYNSPTILQLLDVYKGAGLLAGGFVDQSWTTWNGHLHLNIGTRWDRHSTDGVTSISPQSSLAFSPWSSTRFQLGWGQYVQYPEISQFTSNLGDRRLLPMRSTQVMAAVEQRFTERTRVRAVFYNRQDRDLLSQPFLDPRLVNGAVFVPPPDPLYENSSRGYGRGVEIFLQRVSANGLSGWISYAYGRTWIHDGATGDSFPSDWDQRHTIGAYTSYRVRPTINLSARWTYGSGFPIPAFLQSKAEYNLPWDYVYYLGSDRNRLRLRPYQRLDFRINKSWTHTKWKTTLYGEVVNLTNRTNYRFNSFDAYDTNRKLAYITFDRMFPILPSVGISFER